jgi:hypothetical protein
MPLPKSLPWMEGVDAKIERAEVHLSAFIREAAQYLATARPTIIRKTNVERTTHWLVLYTEDPFPPIELSVLIGDFLYNLRSALDHLVCGLVLTSSPMSDCAKTEFPVFRREADYPKGLKRKLLEGVPPEACRLIKKLQPFQRPTPEDDPLWILHSLCNRDKHRVPILTLGYQKNVEIQIPTKTASTIVVRLPEPFYIGDVKTVLLPGDPSTIEDDVTVHTTGRGILCLRSTEPWAERPADELMTACLGYVRDRVIPQFKPLFRQP